MDNTEHLAGQGGTLTSDKPKDDIGQADNQQIEGSGAILEPDAKAKVDMDHPAVDANPRAKMPADSNRIDFNDPTLAGHEAVAKSLQDQGKA